MNDPRMDAPPFALCSDTSRAAAAAIRGRAGTQRARVLGMLLARGQAGATDEELASELGLRQQSATPRRIGLCKLGLVRDSGKRRPTSSGQAATVWVVTTAAATLPGSKPQPPPKLPEDVQAPYLLDVARQPGGPKHYE